ncbi:glutamate-5-semialdehyde dehydrogenase [Planktothrix agardhii 1806]|jgi:glutamate-5-semialdehyde dehydrogenase|uniref:glutamate-5-semialdehyde dehydrogenase n=1 Tax=Planktothrix agardhii TaxID=1160 RepID=UPI000DBB9118|nr:glutamate-5-semialdehyde dehydrogenase [Planktothrix agardhii]BBD56123.1 gamma-glutamyl phosphate reductase [Planktothrix agardhii NIES-204]MCB8759123.1 glutamate-5-semialdehyde dehydrogenase [Planktothrix agardhii 1813]MCB8787205.1 glutamate-5-semialdehyde dehydrogenase [Planktothrix agardhii 1025]MCF3571783.1 glutamate-5-semialdehyde dehydrogenase [Planktothrix agardhii 1805]MCF3585323.1 glutamate-5-semialdehyde dehydrogenase [Planktothrix agardhii 1803]
MIIDDFSLLPTDNPLRRAYLASFELAKTRGADRSLALQLMAKALRSRQNDILEANTLDLEASRNLGLSELITDWLKLTPERLETTVQILERLGQLPDPIGRVMSASYQLEQGQTYFQPIPLGVVALVYEAFPELAAIATGLCLKTANSLVLLGGTEASHSNQMIVQTLQLALEESGLPPGCLEMLPSEPHTPIKQLITQDKYINLVIPYGRPNFVQQVVNQSTVPVLRSAMGNCYLYWSSTASVDTVRWMILDSHDGKPDAVNAIEKVLIDPNQKSSSLVRLWNNLREAGFELRGDEGLAQEFSELILAETTEWSRPYLTRTVAFKRVDHLQQAIIWMNTHSSGHANCLATESYSESRKFAQDVNSALTFINASPRFSRHLNRGDAIFLGISNQKGYRRGLIGLEALMTLKHVVQGNRQF